MWPQETVTEITATFTCLSQVSLYLLAIQLYLSPLMTFGINVIYMIIYMSKRHFLSNTETSQKSGEIPEPDSSQSYTSHSSSRYKTSISKCWCNYAAYVLPHYSPWLSCLSGSTSTIRLWSRLEQVRRPNCGVRCCQSLLCMR